MFVYFIIDKYMLLLLAVLPGCTTTWLVRLQGRLGRPAVDGTSMGTGRAVRNCEGQRTTNQHIMKHIKQTSNNNQTNIKHRNKS